MKKIYLVVLAAVLTLGVSAQTLVEGFESTTWPPTGWAIESPDGGTGWERVEAGLSPIPGWTGGVVTTAPVMGGTGAAFCTWSTGGATANDQWLITPQFTPVAGDYFNFWIRKYFEYTDKVEVMLSTTGANIADFTVTLATINYAALDTGYEYKGYDLSTYVGQAIYVAFRENVADNFNDGAAIFVDNVLVGPPAGIDNLNSKVYVNVFPNPATDYVDINLSENIVRVEVLNALGQVVLSNEVNEMDARINTSQLQSGIYFLSIETANNTITRKINVIR